MLEKTERRFTMPYSLLLLIFVLCIGLFAFLKLRKSRSIRIINASITVEELEQRAKRTALDHAVTQKRVHLNWPMIHMNESYKMILDLYNSLNDDLDHKRAVPPAAEWLLDNFYIIEEQVKGIRVDLTKKNYYKLPVLKKGPFKGYTRIFAIAMEFISVVDGQIDEGTLQKYLQGYQTHAILFDREIRMIPLMLRLALIENVRMHCEDIKETQHKWNVANNLVDKWLADETVDKDKMIRLFKSTSESLLDVNPSFIEHLFYRLRRSGRSYSDILSYFDEHLETIGTTAERIVQQEHNTQANTTVSMGNYIMSFRNIQSINWSNVFDNLSYVEQILLKDPKEYYGSMDLASRSRYLQKIEKLAKRFGVSELHVARVVVGLAESAESILNESLISNNLLIKKTHVGYYLLDNGIEALEKTQKGKHTTRNREFYKWLSAHMGSVFISTVALTTLIIIMIAYRLALSSAPYEAPAPILLSSVWLWAILTGVALVIPASEIAIAINNWFIGVIMKPAFFPRLELKHGIPDDMKTMVVVPAILNNEKRVDELLGNLENHYLANKEKNLYFALIGAFKDSQHSKVKENPKILEYAIEGMEKLNQKYSETDDIFYFYHRRSVYNETDNIWTGWERKRGALMEFNEMLLGSTTTSFIKYAQNHISGHDIKYIITLDADTVLPFDMALKMIGTMAHPLNLPIIDETRHTVTEGYGLMQPRITFDMDSSNKSIFARIFTGLVGMDPYASAISDVYQDLFGEGIFTGKGIYDLKIFYNVLKDVVPENSVLSHDLLEGSYVRAALVSDLELVDSYPTRYNAYMTRLQRWIRGDWQLIPWLNRIIYNKNNRLIINPLNNVSIWKIFDNLRRSLVAPSTILLMFLGFTILPGSGLFWSLSISFLILFPLLVAIVNQITFSKMLVRKSKRHLSGFFGLKALFFQILLSVTFLPYQAYVSLKAITVTLVRVLITRKKLLEWITSDDAEKMQTNTLMSYVKTMGLSALTGLPLVGLTWITKTPLLGYSVLLALLWISSPVIAYSISLDSDVKTEPLTSDNLSELRKIARRTWRYFEEYANAKNNFLAPDNYQEIPFKGIAPRTSPTNIGLGLLATLSARDFGFIGLDDALNIIDRTVTTIEKLEKWNGHLLNWYDTKTLAPLKPRYISTVDSGNYVCYLITLSEGIKAFAQAPLVNCAYVTGIPDTLRNSMTVHLTYFDDIMIEPSTNCESNIDVYKWYQGLVALIAGPELSKDMNFAWIGKTRNMAESFKREIDTYMPWISMLDNIPEAFVSDLLSANTFELLSQLKKNSAIREIDEKLNIVRLSMNAIKVKVSDLSLEDKEAVLSWLEHLLEAVKRGIYNARIFLDNCDTTVKRIDKLSDETQFVHLYDARRQLFSIGYNLEDNRLSNSFYDLLASEARQTSYIAIARGEVPSKHWQKLGRSLTMVDRYKGLISWSGTMFEYLMPLILMKSYKNTLLDETYSFVLKSQKKYGKERNMPWGVSESAFNSIDIHQDYQYKAIGVPWLGLKRGLIEDAVVAPYATFLALMVDPVEAYKNIELLKMEGLEGQYGYYEAADYTPERLINDEKCVVIKSYMAHHQGMIMLSLNNYVHRNILQDRFYANAYVKAARLLLQEKVPMHVVLTKEKKEKILPYKGPLFTETHVYRRYTKINQTHPKTHVLSNGYYSVMTTDKGTGYSRTKDYAVNRWREDAVIDPYGSFFYLKNLSTDASWSSSYAPYNVEPIGYEVVFTGDKTTYKRVDDKIETQTEIIVTSGDNAEVRRIKVKNIGEETTTIELTSYFEVVMAEQNADVAHRAFSNLFIETEYDEAHNALIAHRRPRKPTEPGKWIAQIPVVDGRFTGEFDYETDRMQFIGRGNTVKNPQVMQSNRPLSKTVGIVLDPVFSFRVSLKLKEKQSIRISFVTLVAESKEAIMELIVKYNSIETCDAAFWLAVIRSQVETRYLNIKSPDMTLYQDMISDIIYLSPMRKKVEPLIIQNTLSQSNLWKFGISGDRPILLLSIEKTDDVEILYEVLKAHEYWRLKDLGVDLIILIKEENNYFNTLLAMVNDIVDSTQTLDAVKLRGDVFIINVNSIEPTDLFLLYAVARMSFNANDGTMETQYVSAHKYVNFELLSYELNAMLEDVRYSEMTEILVPSPLDLLEGMYVQGNTHKNELSHPFNENSLQFYNGIGGFNTKGDAYVIHLENEQMTPLPWSNVIANANFGFVVTESGGGYTWRGNSRENKLTPWSNDSVSDVQGEIFYISDYSNLSKPKLWSLTPLPIREKEAYTIVHGFGYTEFMHTSHGIEQTLTQFVPLDASVKINLISLTNLGMEDRELTLTYYIKPVLGVDASQTAMHIKSELDTSGALTFSSIYNQEYLGQVLYMSSSSETYTVCADRGAFFGLGDAELPMALSQVKGLNNQIGSCLDPCGALQVTLLVKAQETVKCVFLLGVSEDAKGVKVLANRYRTIRMAEKTLEDVKAFWAEKLSIVQINTPDTAMNILMNGWLLYQVITCRMWARTAFYQAGGAYGFRDQLQDSLALLTVWPELAREQILKHAAHQFEEGDVLHWWHEPSEKGPRTKISDDYLWLSYVTAEYVRVTGDESILDSRIHFLKDEPLLEHEEERYSSPAVSHEDATLYEHCIRAMNHGLNFGEHGLPLMGGGDWNDGMNMVGIDGKGESIWLGWFLFKTLKDFIPHCFNRGDIKNAHRFETVALELAAAIDEYGWDGKWYRRAYFDDGTVLGTESRSECKIDAIAQAWSVISGGGDAEKMVKAMSAVEAYLINKEDGLIKLLTPPFDRSDMEPGYIKGYVPGVRENGGQYTHGATWVIAAYALLGDGDKAHELFELINPINHSRTYREMMIYKAEPYVMAADVYSCYPHVGRGGWSWYTGAAGWMYQTGLEHILGFRREGETIFSYPCIPKRWDDEISMVRYDAHKTEF